MPLCLLPLRGQKQRPRLTSWTPELFLSFPTDFNRGDAGEAETGKSASKQVEEGEAKMKGELEPSEQNPLPVARTLSADAA